MATVPHRNSKHLAHLPRSIKEGSSPQIEHRRAFGRYHTGALGLTVLAWESAEPFFCVNSLAPSVGNDNNQPTIPKSYMGTTSGPQFLSEDGLPYGMPSGASPALHLSTPFGNPPVLQTTVEAELLAQMTSLRKEMAKLQEHNNLLSSKVDETQRLLNQQDTQNIQPTEPSQSLQTPGRQKKGNKGQRQRLRLLNSWWFQLPGINLTYRRRYTSIVAIG
ncbi:unnamed protein product [Prunus brigantina]